MADLALACVSLTIPPAWWDGDAVRCTCPTHIGDRNRPRTAFRADWRKRNGVHSWCRECEAKARKARRARGWSAFLRGA